MKWSRSGIVIRNKYHSIELSKNNSDLECVIINWKRPNNIPIILERLSRHNVYITLINLPDSKPIRAGNRIIMLENNHGSANRYVPWELYKRPYTLFIDDDTLPQNELFHQFKHQGDIGVIGCNGRRVVWKDNTIVDYRPSNDIAHFVVRLYYVKSSILSTQYDLLKNFDIKNEDDIAISFAAHLNGLKTKLLSNGFISGICLDKHDISRTAGFRERRIEILNSFVRQYGRQYYA